jgi:hypothetical protein
MCLILILMAVKTPNLMYFLLSPVFNIPVFTLFLSFSLCFFLPCYFPSLFLSVFPPKFWYGLVLMRTQWLCSTHSLVHHRKCRNKETIPKLNNFVFTLAFKLATSRVWSRSCTYVIK